MGILNISNIIGPKPSNSDDIYAIKFLAWLTTNGFDFTISYNNNNNNFQIIITKNDKEIISSRDLSRFEEIYKFLPNAPELDHLENRKEIIADMIKDVQEKSAKVIEETAIDDRFNKKEN